MRTVFLVGFVCLLVGEYASSSTTTPVPEQQRKVHLLGAKECTWGPSYWCKNVTTAAGCHAVKHCIQTVWVHQTLPPDDSSVCQTCLEMVKEARDQLLSNETQEEIKEVFEGSCKLLPIKAVAEECCKLADEFIPELIDMLASQMNPQVVCSVAGLCNNERVHELLHEAASTNSKVAKYGSDDCADCHTVIDLVEKKFHSASRDQVLEGFMKICSRMGSLADSCSNIILTYFNDIYRHLEENLNSQDFCRMAGECRVTFHSHIKAEVTPLSSVGLVPLKKDDLPCALCEQLVKHLQDVLVADTTEEEFHKVLLGICKQTRSFKDECISIVDEYYPIIYKFLVDELNGTVVCSLIHICPGPDLDISDEDSAPIMPLLPLETVQNPMVTARQIIPVGRVEIHKGGASVQILQTPETAQLPIERLVPQTLTIIGNTELCEFCQYFLHFVQQMITDPKTEEKLKEVVDAVCDRMPSTINDTCRQFVDTYGPAFIAILAQDIDPSLVCPKLSLCPSQEAHDVEVFMHRNKGEKPNCALCLFAISSLEEMIQNKRTEENIRKALKKLCSHFNGNLQEECSDFIETYTDEVIEACLAEMTPQQLCVYLKVCKDKTPPHSSVPKVEYGGSVATNEIPDGTVYGKFVAPQSSSGSQLCILCEFIMSQLDQELKNNATEEEIKRAVHSVCNHLPKSIRKECNNFVDQYADAVIELLIESLEPSQVCQELKFCNGKKSVQVNTLMNVEVLPSPVKVEGLKSPQCTLCKMVMTQLEKLLAGNVNEKDIINALHEVCSLLPNEQEKECNDFISKNGKAIIDFLKMAVQPSEICSLLFLCASDLETVRLDVRKCTVCEAAVSIMDKILANPHVDHGLEHVLEKTCRALPTQYEQMCRNLIDTYGEQIFFKLSQSANPNTICKEIGLCVSRFTHPFSSKGVLVGSNKCTWGPGYWCDSEENASSCGAGAIAHCQQHVWSKKQGN